MGNCLIVRKGAERAVIFKMFDYATLTYADSIYAPQGIQYMLAIGAYVWSDAYGRVVLQGSNDNSTWETINDWKYKSNVALCVSGTNTEYKYYRMGGQVARTQSQEHGNQMMACASYTQIE